MIDTKLTTFITIVKYKSFTKAADILHITQPAVSQHIKFLEEYYEVSLIKKQGRSFTLTQEGEILYNYAKEIDLLYKGLETKLKNRKGFIKTYNVGATLTIGGYVLPLILGKYKKIHQNIDILLQVNNTKEILQKLLNGNLDFAIVEGPFDKNKFKYKKFKNDELILAVSPEHPFAKAKNVSLEDVINGNLILREQGSGTRKIFENKLIELGYDLTVLNGYMEIGSISAIKSLIELNLGYTIISKETIKRELNMGTIKTVPIKEIHIDREFNFVYLQDEEREYIEQFMDFCFININE